MKERNNLEEELREITPFLSTMKKEGDGFKVPENYFKNLPDEIIGQLPADNQNVIVKEGRSGNWFTELLNSINWLLQPRLAMAFGSVLLLVFAGLFLLNSPSELEQNISLSDISLEELEMYFEENIDEYDTGILVEGNEILLDNELGNDDDLNRFFEGIIEESELEDLL